MNNIAIVLYYIAFVVLAAIVTKKDAYDSKERLPFAEVSYKS